MATATSSNVVARVWSELQEVIFTEFVDGTTHIVVRARAGTGKTTSIVEAVRRLLDKHPTRVVIVCAFNKNIADELVTRFVGYNVIVKTLHAIGLSCVKRFWPDVKVSFGPDRANDLAQRVCGPTAPDDIKKLVAKLCTKAREIAPHATTGAELLDIAIKFECEPDETWIQNGFGLDYVCDKAAASLEVAANEKPVRTGIDGSDMIFLPVRNHWLHKMCDDVVVDEAQDMTKAQLEIAQGIARGRIVVVGDNKQAIYGFRGADSDSLDRLKSELNAVEHPLNITYRCAQSIVREAQRFVPDFQAGPSNAEGSVEELDFELLTRTASAGDFVLSRVNAPLVSVAMSLLRAGKRTRIAGRDIGAGLISLIKKFKATSVPNLIAKISKWEEREIARLATRFNGKLEHPTYVARADAIHDQAEMLTSLTDNAKNVRDVEERIYALFTDDGLGAAGMITCSSVHKAKGLEADRVFILADTLRLNNDEERNINYVAITRAKSTLVYVTKSEVR
jgi:superfamily I DNA/RNA helicase